MKKRLFPLLLALLFTLSACGGAGSGGIAVKNGNGTITPGTPGSGGLGGPGGPSADGCVILYYRKFGQAKAGPLVQKGGGLFFDRLNKLFIV